MNRPQRPRPSINTISYSSFENTTGGWSAFGSTIQSSEISSKTGNSSLLTSERTLNWHSPKLVLDNLLTVGETFTFYVWVKLAQGVSGTTQLSIKNTTATSNQYENLISPISSSDQEWTLLSGNYIYSDAHNLFVYVKGPTMTDGGGDYYIDDFSLVTQGATQIDFSNIDDIIDIGAYESIGSSLSNGSMSQSLSENIVYPNPALDKIHISKTSKKE